LGAAKKYKNYRYVLLGGGPLTDLVYHFIVLCHGICIVLYLQWKPRESRAFREWWGFNWLRTHYFRFVLKDPHKTLERREQMVVAIHPHGVYPACLDFWFACQGGDMLRFKAVATSVLFKVPILKEFAGLAGAIPANRADMLTALSCRDSLVLAPGGIRELFQDPPIVKRLGFIKICMAAKVPVVPVWSQGENDLYRVWIPWPWLQKWLLSNFWYPFGVCSWGLWWLPFWPARPIKPMEIRVGTMLHPTDYKTAEEMYTAFYEQLEALEKNCYK
jgi:1-acyl-sn-glycerol-3-phosphate acyltransferase